MRPRTALSSLAATLLLTVALAPAALAADPPIQAYGGALDGAQEVPPVASTATGSGTVVISADESTIWYVVSYADLSGAPAAAHIHLGAAGANGGVLFPLAAGSNPMVGTLTAADFSATGSVTTFAEAIAAIRAGDTYFNVHTAAYASGEIRGQITAGGDAMFADLSGDQEEPAVSTSASGTAWVVLSDDGSTITYYVSHDLGDSLTAAHIHLGAAGANGGVLLPLAAGASPMTGVLDASDLTPTGDVSDFDGAIAAIRAGDTYVNLHTATNPGGELRGQIGGLPAVTITPPPTSAGPATTTPSSESGAGWLAALFAGVAASAVLLWRPRGRRQRG